MYNKKSIEEIIAAQNATAPRRKPRDEEHQIQCACVKWFNLQYPQYRGLLHAVPNGGARSKATAGKLKAEGVVAGVSDLELKVASNGWHGLCIEMKTKKGRLSDVQRRWLLAVYLQGYQTVVCRSLEEFMGVIKDYLTTEK